MGAESPKKTPAKKARAAVKDRRSEAKVTKSTSSSPVKGNGTPRTTGYTHLLPTETQRKANGRLAGRKLLIWDPVMDQRLMLNMAYELTAQGNRIPWDHIAHRLDPGTTGPAVLQHLSKLRAKLFAQGYVVPPVVHSSRTCEDVSPEVRGYIRADLDGNDRETAREVLYSEWTEHRKFPLPVGGFQEEVREDLACPVSLGDVFIDDSPPHFGSDRNLFSTPEGRDLRQFYSLEGSPYMANTLTSPPALKLPGLKSRKSSSESLEGGLSRIPLKKEVQTCDTAVGLIPMPRFLSFHSTHPEGVCASSMEEQKKAIWDQFKTLMARMDACQLRAVMKAAAAELEGSGQACSPTEAGSPFVEHDQQLVAYAGNNFVDPTLHPETVSPNMLPRKLPGGLYSGINMATSFQMLDAHPSHLEIEPMWNPNDYLHDPYED